MASRKKSWKEKFDTAKAPHVDVLKSTFAGLPAGARLLIPSPKLVADYVSSIPRAEARTIAQMRDAFTRSHGVDGTCPITTSMFLRIAAEAALEERQAKDTPVYAMLPFWRVIDRKSPLLAKLSCGPEFIEQMRTAEGLPA
jgi:hypothetical protein